MAFISRPPVGAVQDMRTKLDEKMMHNVRTAVKEADALLVILDATEDAAAALAMVNLGPDWRGPPVALVRSTAPPAPPCQGTTIAGPPQEVVCA